MKYSLVKKLWPSLAGVFLVACGGGDGVPPPPVATPAIPSYKVEVINATNNQPLSPVAVISHTNKYSAWDVGSAASVGIENLAEGGSNSQLSASLTGQNATFVSGTGAIGPSSSETINITAGNAAQSELTIATMLVNTNDAFAGLRSVDVSGLAAGDSLTLTANVYDAGTELNSESAGTMPGPADGGEGFNAARTDVNNIVRLHGGVVTADDGLASSVLNQSHRFDNPGMIVTITRI